MMNVLKKFHDMKEEIKNCNDKKALFKKNVILLFDV